MKLSLDFNQQIHRFMQSDERKNALLKLQDSKALFSFLVHQLKNIDQIFIVFPTQDDIHSFKKQSFLKSMDKSIYTFNFFDTSPYSELYPNPILIHKNLGFLHHLFSKSDGIFLTDVNSFSAKLPEAHYFNRTQFCIKVGDSFDKTTLQNLIDYGYEQHDLVEDSGSFSVRGGIIDVFSPMHEYPARIELFGDDIESIRFFDPDSQISTKPIDQYNICPARLSLFQNLNYDQFPQIIKDFKIESSDKIQYFIRKEFFKQIDFYYPLFQRNLSPFFLQIPDQCLVFECEPLSQNNQFDNFCLEQKRLYSEHPKNSVLPPDAYFESNTHFKKAIQVSSIELNQENSFDNQIISSFFKVIPPKKVKSIDESLDQIQTGIENSFLQIIFINIDTRIEKLKYLLESRNIDYETKQLTCFQFDELIRISESSSPKVFIYSGFIDDSFISEEYKIAVYSEKFIFGNSSKKPTNNNVLSRRSQNFFFNDLQVGDKVVHSMHGIGIYQGLEKLRLQQVEEEFLKLFYKDKDKLFVPVYKMNLISKYDGHLPVDKLGSGSWEKAKIKVKNSLRDLASELLQIYAKRISIQREIINVDEEYFYEFESKFPYEETEDQLKAVEDIKSDLSRPYPMDRLICGDVGFGKTEIAMRAAFRVVQQGRQVAVLVPTTVLCFQHYENFIKRFKEFPVKIGTISRFLNKKETSQIIKSVNSGEVDILIGTHRILNPDIKFKNLGLMIVDEEHRFGVSHKEKIKKMKYHVDALALSATPIPRTLNMSLLKIRNLSIIATAPIDRLPIRTFLLRDNKESVRSAILNEIKREGQIYYLHNRVQSIHYKYQELRDLVPEARIKIGHGQMKENELEETMLSFYKHEFDILLCTTIIESGLDNSKANTIIIEESHKFGLSQLYQIRGRVGRSKERGYCYLMIPKNVNLDKTAQERLRVLQDNTKLGSGFMVAQSDLELRGAGNLLGEDQSGHANILGYDLYIDLLNQCVADLKGEVIEETFDPEISIPIPVLIPHQYMSDIRSRLYYYKRLSDIKTSDDLTEIEDELKDQFGKIPDEVLNLMGFMLIKLNMKKLGIRELKQFNKKLSLSFSESTKLPPEIILKQTMSNPSKYRITPENKFLIHGVEPSWPSVLSTVESLVRFLP